MGLRVQQGNISNILNQVSDSAPANSIIVQAGCVGNGNQVASDNTGNVANTKRTEQSLQAKVICLCNGLSGIKPETINSMLEISSGKTIDELLNVEDDIVEEIIRKIGYAVEEAKLFAGNNNENINDILINVVTGYKLAEDAGADLEDLHTKKMNSYDRIINILNEAGISNIKKETIDSIIEASIGGNIKDIASLDESEINKAINRLENYVIADAKFHANNNQDLDATLIRLANEYHFAEENDMNVDAFYRNRMAGNTSAVVRKVSNNQDWNSLTAEQKTECISEYKNTIEEMPLNDFNELLLYTNKDRDVLLSLIPRIAAKDRVTAQKNAIQIHATAAERQPICNKIVNIDYQEELMTTPDKDGNYVNADEYRDGLTLAFQYADEEHITSNLAIANSRARDLYTEDNIEKYNQLLAKVNNGEELEPEDIEFMKKYEFQGVYRSAQMLGTSTSEVITDEAKVAELLDKMNRDAYEFANPVYQNIISNICEYISNHEELLQNEHFIELIDRATNGNYTLLANSNETVELNPPLPQGSFGFGGNASTVYQGWDGLGFQNDVSAPAAPDKGFLDNSNDFSYNITMEVPENASGSILAQPNAATMDVNVYIKNFDGSPVKAIWEYCKHNPIKFIKTVFCDLDYHDSYAEIAAVTSFKSISSDGDKVDLLDNLNNQYGLSKLVAVANDYVVSHIKGDGLNFDNKKYINEVQEEREQQVA